LLAFFFSVPSGTKNGLRHQMATPDWGNAQGWKKGHPALKVGDKSWYRHVPGLAIPLIGG
jgi:hypothetical protein